MASIALQSGTAAKDGAGAPSRAAVIHRAVLGEAALAAIVKMSPEAKAEFAILDKMVKIVKDAGPFVKKAWSVFGTVASSPIIRLLVDAANKPKGHKESLSDPGISSEIATLASEDQSTETAQDWEAADPGYKNLMEALVAAATEDGQPTDTEAWWGSIAKLVVGGAVSAVGGWVGKKFGGKGETDFDNGETAAPAIPALGDAPLRALIGEAALQALTTVPKEVLQKEHVSESMWSVFKDVLPSVIRLGSDVAASIAKGKKENFQVPLPTPYKKPVSDDPQPREGHECDDLPGLSKKPVNGDSQPPPDFEGPLPAPYKKPVSGDSQTAQRFRTLPFEPQKPTHNSPGPFPSQWGDKLKNAAPLAYSSAVQA